MKPLMIFVSDKDDERALFLEAKKSCALELDWHMLRTPQEVFEMLEHEADEREIVTIIGTSIEGIGQLNFVDALRIHAPRVILVPILVQRDADTVNRAMMAGATAALASNWSALDLENLLKRVLKTHKNKTSAPQKNSSLLEKPSNITAVLSAKGGVGKSVLTAMLAYRFARSGKDVAIVDCDIQFGDMQFLLGASSANSLFEVIEEPAAMLQDISAYGVSIKENVTLYTFGQSPERIELVFGKIATLLKAIAQHHDAVFINTGSFWTLFQFEIIEGSSEVLCVTGQSIVATRATQALLQLCQKMGVPTTQFLYVVNNMKPYGLGQHEIADALSVTSPYSIDSIGRDFDIYIDAGNCEQAFELFEQEGSQFESLAQDLAQKMNLSFSDVDAFQASMKKNPWWRFR